MLSRMSSRVRPSGLTVEDACDQLRSCARRGRGSRRPGRPVNPRSRTASVGGSPSPGRSPGRACRRSRADRTRASRRPRDRRRRRAGESRLVDVGWNRARHVGVNAEQFRRRLHAHLFGDERTPIAALRHKSRVAEALHQHDPGARDARRGPSRSRSACRKIRSPASTESRRRTRPMRSRHVPWDWSADR